MQGAVDTPLLKKALIDASDTFPVCPTPVEGFAEFDKLSPNGGCCASEAEG